MITYNVIINGNKNLQAALIKLLGVGSQKGKYLSIMHVSKIPENDDSYLVVYEYNNGPVELEKG